MGNEREQLEPSSPEKALGWLLAERPFPPDKKSSDASWAKHIRKLGVWNLKRRSACAYILKWAAHGQQREGMRSRHQVQDDIERHPFRAEDCSEPWVQGWLVALEWILDGAGPGDSDKSIDTPPPTAHEVAIAQNAEREAEADGQ